MTFVWSNFWKEHKESIKETDALSKITCHLLYIIKHSTGLGTWIGLLMGLGLHWELQCSLEQIITRKKKVCEDVLNCDGHPLLLPKLHILTTLWDVFFYNLTENKGAALIELVSGQLLCLGLDVLFWALRLPAETLQHIRQIRTREVSMFDATEGFDLDISTYIELYSE